MHFGSKRILEAERRQEEPAKFAGYHKTNFPDLDTRNGIKERGVCIAAHLLSCYANVSLGYMEFVCVRPDVPSVLTQKNCPPREGSLKRAAKM